MKKGILTATLAVVVAAIFSVGIVHARQAQTESEVKIPATQAVPAEGGQAPTEEGQIFVGGIKEAVMICETCPDPNPGCASICVRQVVGRPLSVTSSIDLGSGCTVEFQILPTKRVKLISPISSNQNADDLNVAFNTLCNRLALAVTRLQLVEVGIVPIKTGEAYLYSVTSYRAEELDHIEWAKNLSDVLIDLTVDELYLRTAPHQQGGMSLELK